MQAIQIVTVGTESSGKSSLLSTYIQGEFPSTTTPTVFDDHDHVAVIAGKPYFLRIWDTGGKEDYDEFRPVAYKMTDIFIVCFSVSSPDSFECVKTKWIPEIKHNCPDTPFLLVATKVDLRRDPATLKHLVSEDKKPVSSEAAIKVGRQMGAAAYIECSALQQKGVDEVFVQAVNTVLAGASEAIKPKRRKNSKGSEQCTIM
eukprot:m.310085 g.310085  ORF g.310085 m.310085 type:complete len:202 (+) comp49440_c0_seq1:177-782(+)